MPGDTRGTSHPAAQRGGHFGAFHVARNPGHWGISRAGLVGLLLARSREQGVLEGFVWGACLGPIGWLVIAFTPDRRPVCPECRGPTIRGASRCRRCGVELARAKPFDSPAQPVAIAPEQLVACPRCARSSIRGSERCRYCAEPLAPPSQPLPMAPPTALQQPRPGSTTSSRPSPPR